MADFVAIIPSANADNLVACVRAVQGLDPDVQIIIVDDGAREQAEGRLKGVHWIEGVKPFVFARNINRGLDAARGRTAILLNDDALLQTSYGLTALATEAERAYKDKIGVLSAAVRGVVGNHHQHPVTRAGHVRITPQRLAFVCVAITPQVIQKVGMLDERFVAYGGDDRDYCHRVLLAGMKLGILDRCVVEHSTVLRPTYRSDRIRFPKLEARGRTLYSEKWGEES